MPNGNPYGHRPKRPSRLRTRRRLADACRSACRVKWLVLLLVLPLLLLLWLYYDEFGLPTKVSSVISDGRATIERHQTARVTAAAEREAARAEDEATAKADRQAATATAQAEDKATAVAKLRDIEQHIHLGINAQRQAHGRSPLRHVDQLAAVARAHSDDMVNRNYFNHDTPEGLGPSDRVFKSGYHCYAGENIAIEWDSIDPEWVARQAVNGWMNSPGHRTNILDGQYNRTGVGASFGKYSGRNAWYLTQLFCIR